MTRWKALSRDFPMVPPIFVKRFLKAIALTFLFLATHHAHTCTHDNNSHTITATQEKRDTLQSQNTQHDYDKMRLARRPLSRKTLEQCAI